jgi:hypothetical protein
MNSQLVALEKLLVEQLPQPFSGGDLELTLEDDELLVVMRVSADEVVGEGEGEGRRQREQELIARLRQESRALRVRLARAIHHDYGFVVSWGMRVGGTLQMFTSNATTPVMTRLAREERKVLDTIIAANIANTRSAAISYIIRIYAHEHQDWLKEVQQLDERMAHLREQAREQGEQKVDGKEI